MKENILKELLARTEFNQENIRALIAQFQNSQLDAVLEIALGLNPYISGTTPFPTCSKPDNRGVLCTLLTVDYITDIVNYNYRNIETHWFKHAEDNSKYDYRTAKTEEYKYPVYDVVTIKTACTSIGGWLKGVCEAE